MADVFVSYKREDKDKVARLVDLLRDSGLSTWWDHDIEAGAPWETTIEEKLADASVCIVVWSSTSVSSENVKAEARRARTDGKLIQVFIEDCDPPIFFGERQGINLTEWRGETNAPGPQDVIDAALAIRSGRKPKPGTGYVPKRNRFRWAFLLTPFVGFLGLPIHLDLALVFYTIAIFASVVVAFSVRNRLRIIAIFAMFACLVGGDWCRYAYQNDRYYLADCELSDLDCYYSSSYDFALGPVTLHPNFGGEIRRNYLALIAGKSRIAESHFVRASVDGSDVLLSPSETAHLRYMDGGDSSDEIRVSFQPWSGASHDTYGYSSLIVSVEMSIGERRDWRELSVMAGRQSDSKSHDYFRPNFLASINLAPPTYNARRSDEKTLGFSTTVSDWNERRSWERAVFNDVMFRLHASDRFESTLADLSQNRGSMSEIDNVFLDSLTLSFWCARSIHTAKPLACAHESNRLAETILRLQEETLPIQHQVKLKLSREIVGIVVKANWLLFIEEVPFEAPDFAVTEVTSSRARWRKIDTLIGNQFPLLRSTQKWTSVPFSDDIPTISPFVEEAAFQEYLKGVSQLPRADALRVLLPIRRDLADEILRTDPLDLSFDALFSIGESDLQTLDAFFDEDTGLLDAKNVPATYSYLRTILTKIDRSSEVRRNYARVDAEITRIGGNVPSQLRRSRRDVDKQIQYVTALRTSVEWLTHRLDQGTHYTDFVGFLELEEVHEIVLPKKLSWLSDTLRALSVSLTDFGMQEPAECLSSISQTIDSAASWTSSLTEVLREGDWDLDTTEEAYSEFGDELAACNGMEQFFYEDEIDTDELDPLVLSYVFENPVITNAGAYMSDDSASDSLVSSKQHVVSFLLDNVAGIAEALRWLAGDEDAVTEWSSGPFSDDFPVLTPADLIQTADSLCAQWREPFWAYSEIDNSDIGWRRLPLFFTLLNTSRVCSQQPDPIILRHLNSLFGDEIVSLYLGIHSRPEGRLISLNGAGDGVLDDLENAPFWTIAEAGRYARLSLHEKSSERWRRFFAPQGFGKSSARYTDTCTEIPESESAGAVDVKDVCVDHDAKQMVSLLIGFLQSRSQVGWLSETTSARELFLQPVLYDIDEDEHWEHLPSIPRAFEHLQFAIGSDILQPIAPALLDEPAEVEFGALEEAFDGVVLNAWESEMYWASVHSVFFPHNVELSLRALEAIEADRLRTGIPAVRYTQLLLANQRLEDASEIAAGLLERYHQSDSNEVREIYLENARQVLIRSGSCIECLQELAPKFLSILDRKDDNRESSAFDLTARREVSLLCIRTGDERLTELIRETSETALAKSLAYSSRDLKLYAENYRSGVPTRFEVAAINAAEVRKNYAHLPASVAALETLENLTDEAQPFPWPETRNLVADLAIAAGPDGEAFNEIWAEKQKDEVVRSIASEAGPDARSAYLTYVLLEEVEGETSAEWASQLSTSFVERVSQNFDEGSYSVDPFEVEYRMASRIENPPAVGSERIVDYLHSEEFILSDHEECLRSSSACAIGLTVLGRMVLSHEENLGLITPRNREAVLEYLRKTVWSKPIFLDYAQLILISEASMNPLEALTLLLDQSGLASDESELNLDRTATSLRFIVDELERFDSEWKSLEELNSSKAVDDLDELVQNKRKILKLIDLVLLDYLRVELEQNCCGPVSESTIILSELIDARVSAGDECEWLKAIGPEPAMFLFNSSAKGQNFAGYENEEVLSIWARAPEQHCGDFGD
nr:toll/interleukin-1 receptor domain-containing protein [Hyphomonas sp. Mor2]